MVDDGPEENGMKTLYVNRPLINATTLIEWAKSVGFKTTLPGDDMHVTLAFSKTPVDWDALTPESQNVAVEGGGRKIERLGEQGAVVLRFDSPELTKRWKEICAAGAAWDWPEYKPHVTISYDAVDLDIESVQIYDGPLDFGPEQFKEVDLDWASKVKKLATDSALMLAFDKDSVRFKRRDGQLMVSVANISKATVNPYRGKEIPGWEALGLEPDRIYNLLRDPDELKKAAPTLNGVQLLQKHVPVTAEDHKPYDTVGSLGTDAEFDGTYLKNSVFVNAQDAVDGIESGAKKELSAGYHYKPDMTPGNFDGMRYDGVMREIVFNHVALVENGRAGPDVVVGDSTENLMTKPTRLGALVLMTAANSVAPLLAMDSSITISPELKGLFAGLKTTNFKETKPKLVEGLRKALDGKLRKGMALDATMQGLAKAIDTFEGMEEGVDESVSEPQHKAMEAAAHGNSTLDIPKEVGKEFAEADKGKTFDAEPIKAFLREKGIGEDDITKVCDMMVPKAAMDTEETPEEKAAREKKEKEAAAAKDAEMKDMVSKPAMDAALKAQNDKFTSDLNKVRENERGVRIALHEIKPWVGDLAPTLAFDSGAEVYRHALKMLNVDGYDKMHADALLPVLKVQPKPGEVQARRRTEDSIAMDASSLDKATKFAPGLANIKTVG
jgi:hypothetical protein